MNAFETSCSCFSIVGSERTIDVRLPLSERANWLVDALRLLLDSERTEKDKVDRMKVRWSISRCVRTEGSK
jgi:hypothetical protein